jgi:TonB family protein
VDGRATDFKVIKEEPKGFGFGEAAIDAVKRWRFTPAKKGGKSVPMRVKIPIRFTLDDD